MACGNAAYFEAWATIISCPSSSIWLRRAIESLDERDPIDALKDAETLALLAQLRAGQILAQSH